MMPRDTITISAEHTGIRVAEMMEIFGRLQTDINEWEMLLNIQVISHDGINRQFNSLSRLIQDLAKEALLTRVEFSICGEISNYRNIINRIRQNAMKGIDPQKDLVPSPLNRNLDSVFRNELDLSTIDPSNNRMQRTLEIIEIEDQNLYGPQSNVDRITLGGISNTSVLHQVRDQASTGSELITVVIHL